MTVDPPVSPKSKFVVALTAAGEVLVVFVIAGLVVIGGLVLFGLGLLSLFFDDDGTPPGKLMSFLAWHVFLMFWLPAGVIFVSRMLRWRTVSIVLSLAVVIGYVFFRGQLLQQV